MLTAAAEPELAASGFTLDPGQPGDRSDLVAVVRLLLGWGVLSRVAGDEDAYLSAGADVLYDVRRPVLSVLLSGIRGPSTVTAAAFEGRLAELTAEPVAESDELRNQALRRRLTRRLLDNPVVYYDELDEGERAYLLSQRHAITRRIEEATGLISGDARRGIAMVDPEDELTDVRMPEQRTDGHVTLLVAEYLARREQATLDELHAFVRQAAPRTRVILAQGRDRAGRGSGAARHRAGEADRAARWSPSIGTYVRSRPAIARFALAEPAIRARRERRAADAASTLF